MSGRAVKIAAALAAAAGLGQLIVHAALFAGRVAFPLDLEWMEGGVLVHAQRLMHGQAIYAAPSVDFVPFLYTPLHPALLSVLGRIFGLGYGLGRALSLLSLAVAVALIVRLAVREAPAGARKLAAAVGLAAAGAFVGSFTLTGAFFDLVRADSLLLALEAGAVAVALARPTTGGAAAAALLITLAFLTKQTASVLGVALGVGLLGWAPRRGLIYGATAALLVGVALALLSWASDGWFLTYIFKMHQRHQMRWDAALGKAPRALAGFGVFMLAALAVVLAALRHARLLERRDFVLGSVALGGVVAACVGYGTQWAFENAFIPGVFFPALALGVWTARLVARAPDVRLVARVPVAAAALACVLLAAQCAWARLPDRRKLVPGDRDRAAAARFLADLGALGGEVFIPFHPFYAVLAGKRPALHRMGIFDTLGAGMPWPRGLAESIAQHHWSHVILDWKTYDPDAEFPGLTHAYRVVRKLREGEDSVRMFSGAETSPATVWEPLGVGE